MKELIKKADGSPVKSKIHAVKFLEKKGLDKDCLIEENGQFYYEATDLAARSLDSLNDDLLAGKKQPAETFKPVTWDVEVYDSNNERTQLFIPATDVVATIIGKHPAGQNRAKSAFEINIGDENFIMSVDLLSKIFKVRG